MTDFSLSRRDWLLLTGLMLTDPARGAFPSRSALAAADEPAAPAIAPLNRFPRMVQEYFVRRVRAIERESLTRLDSLQTRADAENYVQDVREKIRQSFGEFPEKTPLNPRVTNTIERDAYRIENVIFESRPGFLVTANLYVPNGLTRPAPGVVGSCGHSLNGKAAEAYQSFAQGLARQGYVCLVFDPIGQGERFQYVDEQLRSRYGGGVREHLHGGNQQFLVGEFFGAWRAWDGIRALDYLLTREEVDPAHVGITGNSGGGTMTTWLCGVEQRWTMAAPSCFVTTFRRNLENELPADTEQCPPKVLALGLDHADFLAALAPRPTIILAKERDYFDVRGSQEALRRLKKLYRLLDAENEIRLFIGPTEHGYTQENREAMYRHFNRVTQVSRAAKEPELVIEPDQTLWCAPEGQVAKLGSKTVFDFTREASRALSRSPARKVDLEAPPEKFQNRLRSVLKFSPPPEKPYYRILRAIGNRKYPLPFFTTYAVETEPGIQAIVYRLDKERIYSRPPQAPTRAILYVAHRSSDAELREEPLLKTLIDNAGDAVVYTCDVRGIGESLPNTCGENSFDSEYGCDYFYAAHSIMLDEPYLGQKTRDVLAVLNWLKATGHESVHLVGKGWGALAATFAALLHDAVVEVTLKNALSSYTEVAETEHYEWPLAQILPDVLRHFDLPECYDRLSGSKNLKFIDPWRMEAHK